MHDKNPESPFSPDFTARLCRCREQFQKEPDDACALACLRNARREIAEAFLTTPSDRLELLFSGGLGMALKALYESDVALEAMTPQETEFCDRLTSYLRDNFQGPAATNHLIAAMMYLRADQLPLIFNKENVPLWFFPIFIRFLVVPPKFFRTQNEINGYRHHLVNTLDFFSNIIVTGNHRFAGNPQVLRQLTSLVLESLPIHPVYFDDGDLKELYVLRARLLEQALRRKNCQLDYQPAPRDADRNKIRVGILNVHFYSQTETFATLPVFEHLDRRRFEIYLYALKQGDSPMERHCRNRADRYFHLNGDLPQQVATLRSHDLDILFIGSNITARSGLITSIALHRTARAHVTSICSPVTTGMNNMDYYIAGKLALTAQAREQFSERVVPLEGSGFCFSFATDMQSSGTRFSRDAFGIPTNAVVFASGANFFKIVPRLREVWTEIIASVPDSVLLLYPFNPFWAGSYPAGKQLVRTLRELFLRHGISDDRLVVHPPLPHRADIRELLKIADVYLDAFPFSGATSLIDPLETGLPTVAKDGAYLRFGQAGMLLRELGVEELVTDSEQNYCELARRLGTDMAYRQRLKNRITERMSQQPAFLDARAFSGKMGDAFERIYSAANCGDLRARFGEF